ncbi:importin subunit alpha [Striga asiatica]|uniref:Importin subunit alpha n=1 Tax=Striga asiatica TaxID=4170 RepID=A0A5A7RH62_STRAF|nr:importin subunit alpha [Striga asiatica]
MKLLKLKVFIVFVEFLAWNDYSELQCQAACLLKNMSAGTSENTKIIVDCGAVPVFVKLLQSSQLCEAAWALGNIAGDSHECRDVVLNNGALQPLLALLKERTYIYFLRIGTWALSNFLEGKPEVPPEQLESAIPILSSVILRQDELVQKEACWALFLSFSVWRYNPSTVLIHAVRALKCIVKGAEKLDEDDKNSTYDPKAAPKILIAKQMVMANKEPPNLKLDSGSTLGARPAQGPC